MEYLVKNSGMNPQVLKHRGSFNTDGAKFCHALLLTALVTKSLTATTWKALLGRDGSGVYVCHLIYTVAEIYNHLGCYKTQISEEVVSFDVLFI